MSACRIGSCLLLLGLLALLGCGSGLRFGEVQGTVTINGKPLDKIQVEFWPEDRGPRSIGVTDSQGRFTLTSDDGKQRGAAVGSHKVILRDVGILGDKFLGRAGEDVDMAEGKKPRIPARYEHPQQTPFTKEVKGGKNDIELEVAP